MLCSATSLRNLMFLYRRFVLMIKKVISIVIAFVAILIFLIFFILNFRHVLNVVFFRLGESVASEFDVPTFRNTLYVSSL
jgi:hypothetical protein